MSQAKGKAMPASTQGSYTPAIHEACPEPEADGERPVGLGESSACARDFEIASINVTPLRPHAGQLFGWLTEEASPLE
eukprot:2561110-Alexandrium_andersonii.AAC.1